MYAEVDLITGETKTSPKMPVEEYRQIFKEAVNEQARNLIESAEGAEKWKIVRAQEWKELGIEGAESEYLKIIQEKQNIRERANALCSYIETLNNESLNKIGMVDVWGIEIPDEPTL